MTPLAMSTYRLNVEEVTRLIQSGVDVNEPIFPKNPMMTPLHFLMKGSFASSEKGLIKERVYKIAKLLLDAGADADLQTAAGYTPLCHALYTNKPLSTIKLLAKKTNLNALLEEGYSHSHYAIASIGILNSRKTLKVIECFYNINPEIIDALTYRNISLIHMAVGAEQFDTLKFLCEKKGNRLDINARVLSGTTALHFAAYTGNLQCIKYLLDRGAKWELKTSAGIDCIQAMISKFCSNWNLPENRNTSFSDLG